MQPRAMPAWLSRIFVLLFACLPWSVEWPFIGWNLTVPAEPLIAIAGIGLAVALLRHGWPKPSGFAWLAAGWIAWQAVSAAGSTMPLVSWKYWLVEAGQCWVFFVGLWCWPEQWRRLFRAFTLSLAGVVVYTIVHHGFYHFRSDQALLAPMPFFSDHTVYSAILVLAGFTWSATAAGRTQSRVSTSILLLFFVALFLSASRAAWLSLALTAFAGACLYFPKQGRWFTAAAVLAVATVAAFRGNLAARLSADVSSRERVNRFACALRMAADRPVCGFGPGTYPFQYLPYQQPAEMTRISLREPLTARGPGNYGRGGGAHSEYLQALSELGWPGLALWLSLVVVSLVAGIRRYRQTGAAFWLLLTLGLLSYFLHGLVNNFLHDARVAALLWGTFAVLSRNFDPASGIQTE